jgi:cell wall-associated NlpC family hydrolase
MSSVLAKTTVSACLAAVPVLLPQALAPATAPSAVRPTDVVGKFGTHYRLVAPQRFAEVAQTTRLAAPQRATQVATITTAPAPQVIPGGGDGTASPPPVVMAAYESAASRANLLYPSCSMTWTLLAAIGEIESHQGASGGSSRAAWNGIENPPILGLRLNGAQGIRAIPDTDHGRYDGDRKWDRAVGPMQFLPGTWKSFGVDADGDGVANPQDIRDAAATAAAYLCKGAANLGDPTQLASAIYSYNAADWYVSDVLTLMSHYADLAVTAPGADEAVRTAIAWAYSHLGDPYQWGGNGPYYDCSGFTRAAYASAGIAIPRTSEQQWLTLPHVADGQLRVGDLVFFNPGEFVKGLPGHVGIYIGSGFMIADPHTGANVQVQSITGAGEYVGAARPALLPVGNPLPTTVFPGNGPVSGGGSGGGNGTGGGDANGVGAGGQNSNNGNGNSGGSSGSNGSGNSGAPPPPLPDPAESTPPPYVDPAPVTDPTSSDLNRHRTQPSPSPTTGSTGTSATSPSPAATP